MIYLFKQNNANANNTTTTNQQTTIEPVIAPKDNLIHTNNNNNNNNLKNQANNRDKVSKQKLIYDYFFIIHCYAITLKKKRIVGNTPT